MATAFLRNLVLRPALRAPMALPKPPAPTIARAFSTTPSPNATLNQVIRVRRFPLHPSLTHPSHKRTNQPPNQPPNQTVLTQKTGLPQTTTRPPRRLPGPQRHQRALAQGRVRESGHHQAQEAQLGRAQDGPRASVHGQGDHGVHPRRGPQHPAAQRGACSRRAESGLSWCAVSSCEGGFGSGELIFHGWVVLCVFADWGWLAVGWCGKQDEQQE